MVNGESHGPSLSLSSFDSGEAERCGGVSRYGLLGENGSGKTTFLRSLADRDVDIPDNIDVCVFPLLLWLGKMS
jgi:polynucleotide 5'-kinase involved in rRNA processing